MARASSSGRPGGTTIPQSIRADDLRRLALRVRRDDHGPGDGEDPVEAARDDVAGKARREPDDVDVGGGERLRKHGARLVVEKLDLVDLEQLAPAQRAPRAARPSR